MNFQQLRSVRETVRCGFNLSEAAVVLEASQSGVSRQIRDLENELGILLFKRSGKRLTGLTSPGDHLLPIIERVLDDSLNLRQAGQDFLAREEGLLSIAATHSQARYALPAAVQEFRLRFPGVRLHLHQGTPRQIAQMLLDGEVDVGIATELPRNHPQLAAISCRCWTHLVVAPAGHPLLTEAPLTIEKLARHPLITYDSGLTGRSRIDEAFARHGLSPDIVLAAMDADVIKTYVELGVGVGIVADLAYDAVRDRRLRALEAGHLFGENRTQLAVRRGGHLRGYIHAFIDAFAPGMAREAIARASAEAPPDDGG
ncbi:CysB family HTH-type transcriptional regulator [Variovorax sp. CY25R-8]|jgi:LysR family cys regulon transcriptional activator|uniref:CysB family HTH-type transcriptional regulator n=1 Tax=Variovorax sp. CY25R-8 TaxID=2855501 RepID=UPI0021BA6DBD|nr:CysB family HTH-type transcriptional regulator [Variovorax sp. CY25R-8]MCT8175648.1 CysB family HTH-type transcriptional regulator [Variovorax sp. CY25R-8]